MPTPHTIGYNGQITYGSSSTTSTIDPDTIPVSGGLQWAVLNQRYDSYDAEKNRKLLLLLHGGYAITEPENAKLFIKKWNSEKANAYEDRVNAATYENNFGEIVNDFGSSLFAKPLMVMPATDEDDETTPGEEAPQDPDPNEDWMQLQTHFDLERNSLAEFMKVQQTQSNALSCSYFGMDFDDAGKPYAYTIDINSVLDYEKDDAGEFIFIVLRDDCCMRSNVRQIRNITTSTFIVWTRENNTVKLDTYEISYQKDKEPDPETLVPFISSISVDFVLIPVVECYTPDSLCVGNIIGQMAESSFVRFSTFLHALNRSSNPILKYKQGAEISANGDLSVIGEDDNRGGAALSTSRTSGAALLGPTDELDWAEIRGDALKIFQQQLKDDKNEMYRLVAQLGSILSAAYGGGAGKGASTSISGDAKQMDYISKEQMLGAYAELVKKWTLKAFNLVFSSKKNDKDILFKCKGMDNYSVVDDTLLLAKIAAIPVYRANIPSPTSLQEMLLDCANEMHPFTSPGTLNKIQNEIKTAIAGMAVGDEHQQNQDGYAQDAGKQPGQNTSKPASSSPPISTSAGSPSNGNPITTGKSGNELQQEGAHLQTGKHIDAAVVYDQLKDDYEKKDIEFVKHIPWIGPTEVPLTSIDFSNKDNWQASSEPDKIDEFADKISGDNFDKPIILVNNPSNDNKMMIVDGHHRALAYLKLGEPANAYIGQVGSNSGPWEKLHSKQVGSKQQSKQKAVSNQVNKSEKI